MSLNFDNNGRENLFRQALQNGINLFCGAGFSIGAKDRKGRFFPIGAGLLDELKTAFPYIKSYSKLDRACTKIINSSKEQLYEYLKDRFTVDSFDDRYLSLHHAKIKKVYTTNIDDLFYKICEHEDSPYSLHNASVIGAQYYPSKESNSINIEDIKNRSIVYNPLHGCVRIKDDYVFGATETVSAYLREDTNSSWRSLARDASNYPILFWGWNFEDPGPISAMYKPGNRTDQNIERWILLYKPKEEDIDYYKSLNFNVIIGDTYQMLEYISENCGKIADIENEPYTIAPDNDEYLDAYRIPKNDNTVPQYKLELFFLDYTPHWCYFFSDRIPKLSKYAEIADKIASGQDIFVIGMRASGKTTLMMQLLCDFQTNLNKFYLVSPCEEDVDHYLKLQQGRQNLLFVDDCFRDTNAIIKLLNCRNTQVVCFDRDFNYERQYHKIQDYSFSLVDTTEITIEDAQCIVNTIPSEIKQKGIGTRNYTNEPTIIGILMSNIRRINPGFIDSFERDDKEAARVFLMISYVHACRVPCSFDMVYSFLGDQKYDYMQMYDIVKRSGNLIQNASLSFSNTNIIDGLQDYYQCRSPYLAQTIINSSFSKRGSELLADVLMDFTSRVGPYKICLYDQFKRYAYDADIAMCAFGKNIERALQFYELCREIDDSEYLCQQAAVYFARNKEYKLAFKWVDEAKNMDHFNRFSIQSTHAQISFEANLNADEAEAYQALLRLFQCCKEDKRKTIHYTTFARFCIKYYKLYKDDQHEKAIGMIEYASDIVKEGLEITNKSAGNKTKRELKSLQKQLTNILDSAKDVDDSQ